ncbi:isochorismate synthase [Luteimicrobium sp. DT211]|uniref:isochorismate synthase n=1 Tax=Luteimicrobium sp. DT211 TaxID=3393412 RepID=UPI003CEC9348
MSTLPAGSRAPRDVPGAAPAPLVVRTAELDLTDTSRPADDPVSRVLAALASDDDGALLDLLPDAATPLAWVRRGEGVVGWGEALRFTTSGPDRFRDAEDLCRRTLASAVVRDELQLPGTGPIAFGSFAFGPEAGPASGTTRSVVIVPRVVVGRRGGRAWVTTIDPAGSIGPAPSAELLDPAARTAVVSPGEVRYAPGGRDPRAWVDVVGQGVARIRAGELDKVVLARDVVATTERPLDPRHLLGRLARGYRGAWTFSVGGMVGATPELLARAEKGLVTSRVLAGTVRRTGNDDADLARAAHLAHSSKDLEEHEYAVRSVARALEPYCSSMNVPESPFVLDLPNVLHLATDVTGVLHDHASSLEIAAALHPTAAVCGTPTDDAAALIAEIEGMERGRYAGPVGWFGADGDGEWGIALRSAELGTASGDDESSDEAAHRIRLFAGCGIVAASDPEAELRESDAKLEPLRFALAD